MIIEKTLRTLETGNTPRLAPEFSTEELKSTTEALLEHIKNLINPNKFHAFFANTFTVASISESTAELIVTTNFIKTMIESHYIETIKQALFEILGKSYEIELQVIGSTASQSSNTENILKKESSRKVESQKQATFFIEELQPTKEDLIKTVDSKVIEHFSSPTNIQIDMNKTFENFIIGPSNNMACAASMAVSKEPGKTYQSLYIYGNSGLGKTHLIHAIANYIQSTKPNLRICITSANRFMNEMLDSMQVNKIHEFKRKYTDQTDVLIIDDIHELKNRSGTQNAFFDVFNELMARQKQLVFT